MHSRATAHPGTSQGPRTWEADGSRSAAGHSGRGVAPLRAAHQRPGSKIRERNIRDGSCSRCRGGRAPQRAALAVAAALAFSGRGRLLVHPVPAKGRTDPQPGLSPRPAAATRCTHDRRQTSEPALRPKQRSCDDGDEDDGNKEYLLSPPRSRRPKGEKHKAPPRPSSPLACKAAAEAESGCPLGPRSARPAAALRNTHDGCRSWRGWRPPACWLTPRRPRHPPAAWPTHRR